jgi:ubiquinone biosynthesis accessory factor UbiJ
MATSSPFSFPPGLPFSPPAWATDEIQKRLVLLLNHVLQQEPEAMTRLARKKGQVALVKWRELTIKFIATPAGLLDLAAPQATAHLTLEVTQQSPLEIIQALFKGEKPDIRIDGDVQLAAEVNWLVEHVRWDVEEDLARIVGDVPAHAMGQVARRFGDALRQFGGIGKARDAAEATESNPSNASAGGKPA